MKSLMLIAITGVLLVSCSFNGMFLFPTKISKRTEELSMITNSGIVRVHFEGNNLQPVFKQNNGETFDLGYSLKSFVYKNSKGKTLNGWLLTPRKMPIKATIMHLHGNAGNLLYQLNAISSLVNEGYQLFMFDYSGFGLSEGKATKRNVLADALSSMDFLLELEEVKNTRIVLYGQSLGGHLSAVVGKKRQKDIAALVIEGAFSSHKDIAAERVPILGRVLVKQDYCAYKSIRKFNKPLLVIHSREDSAIPLEMGKKIFKNANEPKEFFEINGCHLCGPTEFSTEISEKIDRMLDQNKQNLRN